MSAGRRPRLLAGALAALLLSASALFVQHTRARHPRYDRFTLPSFDAYVYVAMADEPSVFTLSPWGYRLLAPALARALPGHSAGGFRFLTALGLLAAAVLLFFVLARLGVRAWLAVAGAVLFVLSPPALVAVDTRFLVEPLTVALEVAWLLALEGGAGPGALALILATGALSKEVFVLFAPAVAVVEWRRRGPARALAVCILVALPAVAGLLGLRLGWQPHQSAAAAAQLSPWAAFAPGEWRRWAPAYLLGGLLPVAAAGALTSRGRAYLSRHGYMLALTLVLPVAAGGYVSAGAAPHFFSGDVPRLLLYALPLLFPLAGFALEWPLGHRAGDDPGRPAARRWLEVAAWLLALVFAAGPLLLVDRYRRLDLAGPRDGPYVMGFCRETLRTARRLERGETVAFDDQRQRYQWGIDDPSQLRHLRWFLREGWGERPHYRPGYMTMDESRAGLVLPLLTPRDVEVELTFDARQPLRVSLDANSHRLGDLEVPAGVKTQRVRVPAAVAFRGDNMLRLSADQPGLRLRALAYRPARPD